MKNHAIDGAQLGIQALETARRERIGTLTHDWLDAIGEDPNREGLQKTPQRVAKAWDFQRWMKVHQDRWARGYFASRFVRVSPRTTGSEPMKR